MPQPSNPEGPESDPPTADPAYIGTERALEQARRRRGGGGNDSIPPEFSISIKEYVDVKAAAVKAEALSDIAGLRSDIASLRADLSSKPSTWTVIGLILALFSAIVAVLAFGGTRFSGGLSLAPLAIEQDRRDSEQERSAKRTELRLDHLEADAQRTGR